MCRLDFSTKTRPFSVHKNQFGIENQHVSFKL